MPSTPRRKQSDTHIQTKGEKVNCVRETSEHTAIKQSANQIDATISTAVAAAILIKRHERRS